MVVTTEPLVSVLISVYNAGEYLRPSVDSILSQTYSNLEILIINDGSTDNCMDTIADLNDPRTHIISQTNSGKAVALNVGLEESSGMFYAIHDADDISHPRRIEHQVRCMLEHRDLAAVFTGHDIILDGRRLAPRFAAKSIQQCRQDIEQIFMPAHDPTAMFRLSMVRNMRYEPNLKVAQGLDYILRVGELYPMMVLGECLYSYRIHSFSNTRQNLTRRQLMVREVLRRAFERRGFSPLGVAAEARHRERKTGIIPHFMESVLDQRRASQSWQALKTALVCLQLHPYDPYYYKPLVYSLAPLALIKAYHRRKARNG